MTCKVVIVARDLDSITSEGGSKLPDLMPLYNLHSVRVCLPPPAVRAAPPPLLMPPSLPLLLLPGTPPPPPLQLPSTHPFVLVSIKLDLLLLKRAPLHPPSFPPSLAPLIPELLQLLPGRSPFLPSISCSSFPRSYRPADAAVPLM